MYNLKIFFTLYFTHLSLCYDNNWHSSLHTMYELFNLETELLIKAETYIKNEYKRLEDIKRFMEVRETQNVREIVDLYLESSTNAFKTILRIKNDWEALKHNMTNTSEMEELKSGKVTQENVVSVLNAIRRLQIIYELDVQHITNGEFGGHTYEKFDAHDCYQMANLCYDNAEFHCAFDWYDETYKKYLEENYTSTIDHRTLIIKYTWSSYLIGNIEKAKDIILKYEEKNDISDSEVIINMRYILWAGFKVFKRNTVDDKDKKFYSHALHNLDFNGEVRSFKAVCQNAVFKSKLKCRYYHGQHKFLIIAPLREEDVSLTPKIKMYHNIIYDNEITRIKELAKPKLYMSYNYNEDISSKRVAKFVKRNDRVFEIIDNRLARISLESKFGTSGKYHVTNYGLSGHYLPHTEYIDDGHLINSNDRQATVIIHMDDVPIGGATVLPHANVHVPSFKGTALIVYSTPSFDKKLIHAQYGSCPIFYGDKWTLTGWFVSKEKPRQSRSYKNRGCGCG